MDSEVPGGLKHGRLTEEIIAAVTLLRRGILRRVL
jgi:hypothetical protein